MNRSIRSPRLPFLAFSASFALYFCTMAPTIYNLDSAELTTASYSGGLVRATGYPLYLIIGRVWSRLPFGDVGFRMNLLSVVCGALTVALCACILRRLNVGPWAMAGSLGLLTVTPFFWAMSLVTEVYTLHTALMCGVLLLLLRWSDEPRPGRLFWCTFLLGLAFGNQAATVLLAPACLWFVLASSPRKALQPASVVMATAGLVLGLSVYLYLPWVYLTNPEFNYAGHYDAAGNFVPLDLTEIGNLWRLVSGRGFAHSMFAYDAMGFIRESGAFAADLGRASVGLAIGPALIGLVVSLRRNAALGGFLILAFLCTAGFFIDYDVVDKQTMLLPPHVLWALWIGIGYQWLLEWITSSENQSDRGKRQMAVFLKVVFLTVVVFGAILTWPLVDLANDFSTRRHGKNVLDNLEHGALLVGWWDTVPVVEYLQIVEGRRPDVKAINRFLIDGKVLEKLLIREVSRRPVYMDHRSVIKVSEIETVPAGPVLRLRPIRREEPPRTSVGNGAHSTR